MARSILSCVNIAYVIVMVVIMVIVVMVIVVMVVVASMVIVMVSVVFAVFHWDLKSIQFRNIYTFDGLIGIGLMYTIEVHLVAFVYLCKLLMKLKTHTTILGISIAVSAICYPLRCIFSTIRFFLYRIYHGLM